MRDAVEDEEQFSKAVDLLQQCVELGTRLPLYYTLPTGRSIEGLCDRLRGTTGSMPSEMGQRINNLAKKLAVPTPSIANYHTYSAVLKEIALRLTFPFEQRQALL